MFDMNYSMISCISQAKEFGQSVRFEGVQCGPPVSPLETASSRLCHRERKALARGCLESPGGGETSTCGSVGSFK